MEPDFLLSELARIAKAFQAPNQALELDIQKVINALRTQAKVPAEHVQALDNILHHPTELAWARMPDPPEPPQMQYEPRAVEVEFFRQLIETVSDGAEWKLPSTDQIYKVDKKVKSFTLLRDTDRPDSGEWHRKTKACLAVLGWKMVDGTETRRFFHAEKDGWLIVVVDFPIEDQLNSATPGKNFPPGSRGQDAWATSKLHPTMVRLYHAIGHELIKSALPDFGVGKSTAVGTKIKENYE